MFCERDIVSCVLYSLFIIFGGYHPHLTAGEQILKNCTLGDLTKVQRTNSVRVHGKSLGSKHILFSYIPS